MAENKDTIAEEFSAADNRIDRIRAILMGTQMQTMEQRIEAIEKRVEQEIADARRSATRLSAQEEAFEKELTALSTQRQQTLGAYEDLARSVDTAVERIHDEITKQVSGLINARFLAQSAEFRTQLNRQDTDLRSSLRALRTALVRLLISELRQDMIRKAAYRRAEQRGFTGGNSEQDWREAEAEIEREFQNELARIEMNAQAAVSGE